MLPRLLAAYKKYGSRAEAIGSDANHRCSNGAVVETTKNGRPTCSVMVRRTHHTGLSEAEGCPSPALMGRLRRGNSSNAPWTADCRLIPSQRVDKCA